MEGWESLERNGSVICFIHRGYLLMVEPPRRHDAKWIAHNFYNPKSLFANRNSLRTTARYKAKIDVH